MSACVHIYKYIYMYIHVYVFTVTLITSVKRVGQQKIKRRTWDCFHCIIRPFVWI